MENHHHTVSPEVTFAPHHASDAEFKKRVWKTTILLSVITVIELGLGFLMYATDYSHTVDLFIKGVIIILSLAKAGYIISIFMHLGDEIRNFIMTVAVPILLFIWFILAFILDGKSYLNLRNKYDANYKERTLKEEHHAPAPAKGGKE
jgi:cytochrome c oxidase subunit IV